MAYVRIKGNQLAVVHGERDASGAVQQRTLFTIYSKAEALAAVGEQHTNFRHMLASENPNIRFDWSEIDKGIRENLDHLPDVVGDKTNTGHEFRNALIEFARELLLADPQTLTSSAEVIRRNRRELEFIQELIEWRLNLSQKVEPSEWNRDNAFSWRAKSRRREVPPEAEEKIGGMYERQEYDQVAALAQLLVDCWPSYAEGHNYLGLVGMEKQDFRSAVGHFEKCAEVARALFPKRLKKSLYWTDHDTRPYIRALVNLAHAHNRLGHYDKALVLCDRLEHECGQDIFAALERGPIALNAGLWEIAAKSARYVHQLYPDSNIVAAFALFEMGKRNEALPFFLHSAIKVPRATRMLLGFKRGTDPQGYDQVRDHNSGVSLWRSLDKYLGRHPKTVQHFKAIATKPEVAALMAEAEEARRKRSEDRSGDRTWFDKMTMMESFDFAERKALEMLGAQADGQAGGPAVH